MDSSAPRGNAVPYDEYNCGCPRLGPPLGDSDSVSLCSEWSSSRGPGQRVVAYSVYGDIRRKQVKKQYYSEIEDRAKEVARLYSGKVKRRRQVLYYLSLKIMYKLCGYFCFQFDNCSAPTNLKHINATKQ